jgi:TctA family transporter
LFILVAVIYYLSGLVGILIFITSTCLGIIAILSEVNVSLLVAVLMVPLIVSFVV